MWVVCESVLVVCECGWLCLIQVYGVYGGGMLLVCGGGVLYGVCVTFILCVVSFKLYVCVCWTFKVCVCCGECGGVSGWWCPKMQAAII